jgi:DHA2 family multidrug resistance protein-like MFS transporter
MHDDRATLLHEDPDVHRRRWLLLGVMCLSLVLVVMAVSSLNVAAPRLQQDLQATATQLHWIIDSYGLVFAGLLLPAGALGDRYGRKGALLLGLGMFAVGLLVAGLADSPGQVITGRAVMGAGSAFVMPATLSLISAVFPPDERTKAIAVWAGFAGAGAAIGPVVAGAMLEEFWWGSAVLVNLPVVAVAAVAVARYSPRSRDSQATPLDVAGSALALVSMLSLLYGIIEGAERGWTDTLVLGSFVSAAVLVTAFVVWELRTEHPMLPMELFRDRRFSVGSAAITLTFFALFGFYFLSTLYLQYVLGYSPLTAGLAGLPLAGAMLAVAPRSAALGERFGPGPVMAAGFATMSVGLAVFTQVSVDSSYLLVAVGFVLVGTGIAMTAAPATGVLMSAVPLDKAGVGSAVNDTTREFGAALGIAVFGTVVGSAYRSGIDFSGTGAPADATQTAEESIGAAWGVAQTLPSGGGALLQEAQTAFVDAFRLSNALSVVVAVAAGALVLGTLRTARPARVDTPASDSVDAALDAVEVGALDDEPAAVASGGNGAVPGVDPALAVADADDVP